MRVSFFTKFVEILANQEKQFGWYKSKLFSTYFIITVVLIASPSPFLAKHQYFPESFLLVSKARVSFSDMKVPFFIHFMVGVGFPVAVQRKVTFVPSITVWLLGLEVKLG